MDLETILVSAAVGAVAGIATQWFGVWISGRYWVAQERWRMKGETYRHLFEALARLQAYLRWSVELKPDDPDFGDLVKRADLAEENRAQLRAATSFARPFVSEQAWGLLEQLEGGLSRARGKPDATEALSEGLRLVKKANEALTDAAKKDFDL